MCEEDPKQFICVLLDEVESIANSRESSMHGEAQDSLRATNALLTGLDRAKKHANIVILCTSNMLGCLDTAFLDRCGLKRAVDVPSISMQYEILRGSILRLISDGVITSDSTLLSCMWIPKALWLMNYSTPCDTIKARTDLAIDRDADLESFFADEHQPAGKLLHIVGALASINCLKEY